jgi:hypothetical protein
MAVLLDALSKQEVYVYHARVATGLDFGCHAAGAGAQEMLWMPPSLRGS